MKKTFTTENIRKDNLFDAWIGYLTHIHNDVVTEDFDELIDGVAHISMLSKNRLILSMENSGRNFTIPIVPEIRKHSLTTDKVFFIIGRKGETWWPVDVVSIGSIIENGKNGFHITVNPLHTALHPRHQAIVH